MSQPTSRYLHRKSHCNYQLYKYQRLRRASCVHDDSSSIVYASRWLPDWAECPKTSDGGRNVPVWGLSFTTVPQDYPQYHQNVRFLKLVSKYIYFKAQLIQSQIRNTSQAEVKTVWTRRRKQRNKNKTIQMELYKNRKSTVQTSHNSSGCDFINITRFSL